MNRNSSVILAVIAMAFMCIPSFAQDNYGFDYLATDNLLLYYRVNSLSSPSSSQINFGGVVPGFSSGESSISRVSINTRTSTIKIGDRTITFFYDQLWKTVYEECVIYTGTGHITRTGNEAPFQMKFYPDKTLYISITWPESFEAAIMRLDLQKIKEMPAPKAKK